jgi:4-methyl-5(b-hydroxyethyl)-thiazole monophosphate biosynthesis
MAKVLIPLATGFEEIEAICVIDILRRAGVTVRTAGLQKGTVVGAHQIGVVPDLALVEAVNDTYAMICLPGGMPGTLNLQESFILGEAIKKCYQGGGYIAAICAAPTVLAHLKLAPGSALTSYPSEKDKFPGYKYREEAVVEDGKIITSRGPGTAVAFALKLVERLVNKETAEKIKSGILA